MSHVVFGSRPALSPLMIGVGEHRQRIMDAVRPLPAETRALRTAHGRALAAEVRSRWPLPLFDASAMDGYAVRAAEARTGATLRVVADLPAGSPADPGLGPGEAARIMTGAPVPSDADAVVPLEHTDLGTAVRAIAPERVTVLSAPERGAHIRRAGEDRRTGEVVVPAGAELTAWRISAIASAGHDRVLVGAAPRVAVISTGTELVPPASTPARGQIPESNSVLLDAAIPGAGAVVASARSAPDDPATLRRALADAAGAAEVIVLTGGASVGSFDVVKSVLASDHGIRFDTVAMQPGKPQGFGVHEGRLVFCLPGSPVGMAVSFEMFVRPALRAMAGFADVERRRASFRASGSWRCSTGRMQVIPVIVDGDSVRPAAGPGGRHPISSLATADGLAVIPEEVGAVDEGDLVSVMLL